MNDFFIHVQCFRSTLARKQTDKPFTSPGKGGWLIPSSLVARVLLPLCSLSLLAAGACPTGYSLGPERETQIYPSEWLAPTVVADGYQRLSRGAQPDYCKPLYASCSDFVVGQNQIFKWGDTGAYGGVHTVHPSGQEQCEASGCPFEWQKYDAKYIGRFMGVSTGHPNNTCKSPVRYGSEGATSGASRVRRYSCPSGYTLYFAYTNSLASPMAPSCAAQKTIDLLYQNESENNWKIAAALPRADGIPRKTRFLSCKRTEPAQPKCRDGLTLLGKTCTSCVPNAEGKQAGAPACDVAVENPINAGTGHKFQLEPIYLAQGAFPLHYQLAYSSRTATDKYSPVGAHGRYWTSTLDQRLNPGTDGVDAGPDQVSAFRSDGKLLGYTRQTDGSYLSDADIADQLVRLSNADGSTAGWRLFVAASLEVETYHPDGRLASIGNRAGLSQSMSYDSNGRLSAITDAGGRALTFAYDEAKRVVRLTLPDNQTIGFGYDGANNLSRTDWPDGTSRSYVYENPAHPNNLTGIVDEKGNRFASYGYDSQGRAISTEHAGGARRATLNYLDSATEVTDALGSMRTIKLERVLGVVRGSDKSQPSGAGCSAAVSQQRYDVSGNVVSRTDFNGNVTSYRYDPVRNVEVQRTEADGTALARVISTEWHPYWRLPGKVAEPSKLTRYVYNGEDGNYCAPQSASTTDHLGVPRPISVVCKRMEQATLDDNGGQGFNATPIGTARVWTYTYNEFGQVLTQEGPHSGSLSVVAWTYYPYTDGAVGKRGNLASYTTADGQTTHITDYDNNGRPLLTVAPNGLTTRLSYTTRGQLASKQIGDELTTYQYDSIGLLIHSSQASGVRLSFSYDPAHRLIEIRDNQGNRISYQRDPMGNVLREEIQDASGTLSALNTQIQSGLSTTLRSIQ